MVINVGKTYYKLVKFSANQPSLGALMDLYSAVFRV